MRAALSSKVLDKKNKRKPVTEKEKRASHHLKETQSKNEKSNDDRNSEATARQRKAQGNSCTEVGIKAEQALMIINFCEALYNHRLVDEIFALDREVRATMRQTGEKPSFKYMKRMKAYIEAHYQDSAKQKLSRNSLAKHSSSAAEDAIREYNLAMHTKAPL